MLGVSPAGVTGAPFDGLAIDTMTQKLKMAIVESRYIGQDIRLLLRPESTV